MAICRSKSQYAKAELSTSSFDEIRSNRIMHAPNLLVCSSFFFLPSQLESYGLIHGDIGVGNFLVSEQGTITLFDFDEAQYSWFVEDIAIPLYYLVYVYGGEDGWESREEQTLRFMHFFMNGYRLENTLNDYWLKQIPLFLKLRELIVYIGAFRNFDGDETFSNSDNQWFKDWIIESRTRIENNVPIVNVW